MSQNILIVGCGSIGLSLALKLTPRNQVFGLKRDTSTLPDVIQGISADVTRPETLIGQLPPSLDYIVYCLTAATFSDEAYRSIYVDGLGHLINEVKRSRQSPRRLFFVSSTSVYQQNDGSWVDEESPLAPQSFSGQRLLEAERLALAGGIPATNIRFSGIYGGTRTRLLKQIREGTANGLSTAYSNRIHEEDCALILEHLINQDIQGEKIQSCYLASDSEPVQMKTLVSWISKQSDIPLPLNIERSAASGRLKRRAGSKKCCNRRLRESGYQFKYPSYREGYGEMISRLKNGNRSL